MHFLKRYEPSRPMSRTTYLLVSGHSLGTPRMHDVHKIRSSGTQYDVDLIMDLSATNPRANCSRLTPKPLTNRQSKLRLNPSGLFSTYVVTQPLTQRETGARTSAPTRVARSRSSGYHTPPRLALMRATMRSESLPASGAPTESACQICEWRGEICGNTHTYCQDPRGGSTPR